MVVNEYLCFHIKGRHYLCPTRLLLSLTNTEANVAFCLFALAWVFYMVCVRVVVCLFVCLLA